MTTRVSNSMPRRQPVSRRAAIFWGMTALACSPQSLASPEASVGSGSWPRGLPSGSRVASPTARGAARAGVWSGCALSLTWIELTSWTPDLSKQADVMEYDARWGKYRLPLGKDDLKRHHELLHELMREAFDRASG
jgi:hypothetical protein